MTDFNEYACEEHYKFCKKWFKANKPVVEALVALINAGKPKEAEKLIRKTDPKLQQTLDLVDEYGDTFSKDAADLLVDYAYAELMDDGNDGYDY